MLFFLSSSETRAAGKGERREKKGKKAPTFGQFSRPRLGSHLVGLRIPLVLLELRSGSSTIFISRALSVRTPSHMRTGHSI
ncbi:uncharacterized [Tachysurus ichikawai]